MKRKKKDKPIRLHPVFLPIETIITILKYLMECSFIADDEDCLIANLAQLMYAYEIKELYEK
ncbi:MAG: hypothetical protein A2W17_03520 [Planctomycetes bacterium RBG_16_41_13]|nr:MAG: hypothetical protein A2W17_03520 [Planctomycetes bacterium RBG_16_41_13]